MNVRAFNSAGSRFIDSASWRRRVDGLHERRSTHGRSMLPRAPVRHAFAMEYRGEPSFGRSDCVSDRRARTLDCWHTRLSTLKPRLHVFLPSCKHRGFKLRARERSDRNSDEEIRAAFDGNPSLGVDLLLAALSVTERRS